MQIRVLSRPVRWGSHISMGPGAKCVLANSEHTQPSWALGAAGWTKCLTAVCTLNPHAVGKEKLDALHPFAVAASTQMLLWHQQVSKQISETPLRALQSVGEFLTDLNWHCSSRQTSGHGSWWQWWSLISRDWLEACFLKSLLRNPIQACSMVVFSFDSPTNSNLNLLSNILFPVLTGEILKSGQDERDSCTNTSTVLCSYPSQTLLQVFLTYPLNFMILFFSTLHLLHAPPRSAYLNYYQAKDISLVPE